MLNRLRRRAKARVHTFIQRLNEGARRLAPGPAARLNVLFVSGVASMPVGVGMIYLPLGVIAGGATAAALSLYLARGDGT